MRITEISIDNYKCIKHLAFKPGKINLFVGDCLAGGTTILEAIGMIASILDGRIDDYSLLRRGIRPSPSSLTSCQLSQSSPTCSFSLKGKFGMKYFTNWSATLEENGKNCDCLDLIDEHFDGKPKEGAELTRQMELYRIFDFYPPIAMGTMSESNFGLAEGLGLHGGGLPQFLQWLEQQNLLEFFPRFHVDLTSKKLVNPYVPMGPETISFNWLQNGDSYSTFSTSAYNEGKTTTYVLSVLASLFYSDFLGQQQSFMAIDNFADCLDDSVALSLFSRVKRLANDKTLFLASHRNSFLSLPSTRDVKIWRIENNSKTKNGTTIILNEQPDDTETQDCG